MSEIKYTREKIQQGIQYFEQSEEPCKEGGEKLEGAVDSLLLAHAGILGVIENLKQAGRFFEEAAVPFQIAASKTRSGAETLKAAAGASVQEPDIYRNFESLEANAEGFETLSSEVQRASREGSSEVIGRLDPLRKHLEEIADFWEAQKRISTELYPTQGLPSILGFAEQWRDSL